MAKYIHVAISAVMGDVGYVKKTRSGGLNYSYAGEAALIQALRPSMVENGIYMHILTVGAVHRENYTTSKGTAMVNTVVEAIVRFTHAPSGTSIDVAAVGEGSDAGDKSANKAMTGLYKYALRQTFCIETGDDPDKHASEERSDELIDDKSWTIFMALCEDASKWKVPHKIPDRAKTTKTELRAMYNELRGFVSQAEAQAKVGE